MKLNFLHRLAEENDAEELSVNDMTELEQELGDALGQTRLRKVIMFYTVPGCFLVYALGLNNILSTIICTSSYLFPFSRLFGNHLLWYYFCFHTKVLRLD